MRAPHASVLATVDLDGTQATAELAGHLVACGYLELRPDPTDRRAKLFGPGTVRDSQHTPQAIVVRSPG